MNIEQIRKLVSADKFFITDHALLEAFKDGINADEIVFTLQNGKIIEDYPERKRSLLFAILPPKIYLHLVVDYYNEEQIEIVTVYIPSSKEWIKGYIRKKGD